MVFKGDTRCTKSLRGDLITAAVVSGSNWICDGLPGSTLNSWFWVESSGDGARRGGSRGCTNPASFPRAVNLVTEQWQIKPAHSIHLLLENT